MRQKKADFQYESELYAKQLTSTSDYNKARIAMEQSKAEFFRGEEKTSILGDKIPH